MKRTFSYTTCSILLALLPIAPCSPTVRGDQEPVNFTLHKRGDWDNLPADTYERYVHKRCSSDQVLAERVGWAEAGLLANALKLWVPATKYQAAVDMYMGSDSQSTGGWFFGTNYKQRLLDAFDREYNLHAGKPPGSTYTYIYCDEDDVKGKLCSDSMGAYEWDEIGIFRTNHYIVLCPYYFTTQTMSQQLQSIKSTPSKSQTINNLYWNQGTIYFHETFHMKNTVTNPRASDPAYGPEMVYQLALAGNTEKASVNADSYTMTATAMFLQKVFDLSSPPIPVEESRSGVTVDSTALKYNGQTAPAVDPPAGWVSAQDVNDPNSQPDPMTWTKTETLQLNLTDYDGSSSLVPTPDAPAPVETLQCHGISGNNWVVSRDVAAQNAADFCHQPSNSVEYNQGTVNDLRLSLHNTLDPTKPISSAPDCTNKFVAVVLDSCDGGDTANNPFNYKFGSTYTTSDGWVYAMEPLAVQLDTDNCDVSYKFLFDEFQIRGKNFPNAKLGTDGSGLLTQLKGCGDVTDWGFELTPDDTVYQWYAHGHLPIGVRSCVGRATESAGGTTAANCVGSG